jgi:hypothetical protein
VQDAIGHLIANTQIIGASIHPAPARMQKGHSPLKSILKLKLKDAKIYNTKLKSAVKCLTFSNKRLTSQCKRLCDWMTSLCGEKRNLTKRLHQQAKASDMLLKALIVGVEERIECAHAMLLQAEAFSAQHFKNSNLHAIKIGELKTMNIDLQVSLSKARKEKCHAEGQLKRQSQMEPLNKSV